MVEHPLGFTPELWTVPQPAQLMAFPHRRVRARLPLPQGRACPSILFPRLWSLLCAVPVLPWEHLQNSKYRTKNKSGSKCLSGHCSQVTASSTVTDFWHSEAGGGGCDKPCLSRCRAKLGFCCFSSALQALPSAWLQGFPGSSPSHPSLGALQGLSLLGKHRFQFKQHEEKAKWILYLKPGNRIDLLGVILPQQSQMAEWGERGIFAF